MANRFWVGGTATWDATAGTKWATTSGGAGGAAVPTAADDVFFDGASGAGNITIGASVACRSLNCTGFTGTLTHDSFTLSIGDATAGASNIALKFVAGMTYTIVSAANSFISFKSTSATVQTIDTGGKTLGSWDVNGAGSSYQLISSNTTNAGSTVTLASGTLNTNGQTCSWGFFNGSGATTRTLTLGASQITLTGGAGTHWNFGTAPTGLTFNRGTSLITFNPTSSLTFAGGNQTFYDVVFNHFGGTGMTINGSNTFRNLTFNAAVSNYNNTTMQASQTSTVTGTLGLNGNSALNRLRFITSIAGSAHTFNAAATSAANFVDLMDITVTGAGSPVTGSSLGNMLGCSGITFTAATTRYRVGAGGNWTDTANWSTSNGGAGGASVPLAQDDVVINANASGTIAAGSLTTRSPLGKNIDFTGFTGTWGGGISNLAIFGNLTLSSGMTAGASISLGFYGRGTHTVATFGKNLSSSHQFQAPGGTYSLSDAFTTSGGFIQFIAGTFNSNNYNITCVRLNATTTDVINITNLGTSTVTLTETGANNVLDLRVAAGFITYNFRNTTFVLSTASSNQRVINASLGNGIVFGDFIYTVNNSSGILRIQSGNHSFNSIKIRDNTVAKTVTFLAGLTTTIRKDLDIVGSPGIVHVIQSSGASTTTISKASGIVSCDYVNISWSTATGGAYFAAGANSTNGGNNVGWVFGAASFPLTIADSITTFDNNSSSNLIANSGMESDISGWSEYHNPGTLLAELSRDTTVFRSGVASLKIKTPVSGFSYAGTQRIVTGYVVGKEYVIVGYVKGTPGNNLNIYAGTGISQNYTLTDEFEPYEHIFTAISGGGNIYFRSSTPDHVFWLDDAQIYPLGVYMSMEKSLAESISLAEAQSKAYGKAIADTVNKTEVVSKDFAKPISDTKNVMEAVYKAYSKYVDETSTITEDYNKEFTQLSFGGNAISIENYEANNIRETSELTADVAADATTITVKNPSNFAQNLYLVVGTLGSERAEMRRIDSVSGSTITLASGLSFAHSQFEPVNVLNGNQIVIYRADMSANQHPIIEDYVELLTIGIDADQMTTEYNDVSGTEFSYYRAAYRNSATGNESQITDSVAVEGTDSGEGGWNYVEIDDIRTFAGLQNNTYISNVQIDDARKAAQDEINGMLVGLYTLPLDPIPDKIKMITKQLASGLLLTGGFSGGYATTNAQGQSWLEEARSELAKIKSKASTLTVAGESLAIENVGGFRMYPNASTASLDRDSGGRMFSVEDRY